MLSGSVWRSSSRKIITADLVAYSSSRLNHPFYSQLARCTKYNGSPVKRCSCILLQSSSRAASNGSQSQEGRKKSFFNITWYSALISGVFGAGAYIVYRRLQDQSYLQKSSERIEALAETGIGKANWALTDQYNKRREFTDLQGQWLMLYFGFCHCPDICPEELEKLMTVVKGIDGDARVPEIQPVFITLDPERDTVQYMNKYCKDFSQKLIGLTGTTEEVAQAAKSFRVYYSLGEKDEDGDYIVDHTICMYLINPKGQLIDVYERRASAEGIVKGSISHMIDYSKLKIS